MALTDMQAEIEEVREYLTDYYESDELPEYAYRELNEALDRMAFRLERAVV